MLETEANTIKWIGNKYVNEVVTKDLNRFLIELSLSLQNQKKSYATVDKIKLDSNEEGHYLILKGNKRHKCRVKEVIEIIEAHLENEFNIHTRFNLNEIRYGKRGSAGWEDRREFSLLLKVI